MSFDLRTIEINNKVEQVRFGSELALRTAAAKNYFVYADGYIDSRLFCINAAMADEKQISFGSLE